MPESQLENVIGENIIKCSNKKYKLSKNEIFLKNEAMDKITKHYERT